MSVIVTWSIVVALVFAAGFLYVNRPQLILVDAAIPDSFPAEGFSHAAFENLLNSYVDDAGRIDYARWHASSVDRRSLEQYLAAIARFSPESTPERFDREHNALAYWLYGYNAYVIYSILLHWPIDSVTDVRAPVEAVEGLGFFYRQRFLFGGEALSLYAVEHEQIIESYRDPRVHFVLNCASESCPVLKPELPTGDGLEILLESSAHEFINEPRNVHVDESGNRVVLSTIFRWYRKDFVNDLRRRGLPSERGIMDYIRKYASPELTRELDMSEGYEIVYDDYDWALNNRVAGRN